MRGARRYGNGRDWWGNNNPRYYGRGYGRGLGLGLGFGRYNGRGNPLPYCRWNPNLPRGWWRYQNLGGTATGQQFSTPPGWANYPAYTPDNDTIDYQINLIRNQIEFLEKEIDRLKSLKKRF